MSFELNDLDGVAKEIILNYLGNKHAESLIEQAYGYEVALPIQSVPDIARELAKKDIAIYQIVRYAKTDDVLAIKK